MVNSSFVPKMLVILFRARISLESVVMPSTLHKCCTVKTFHSLGRLNTIFSSLVNG
ncbi:hypothetical protein RB213_011491, partial [Colletotrichum asianum]